MPAPTPAMADTATTADRTVAVYWGPGLPVNIPLKPPTTVAALGTAVLEELHKTRSWAHVSPSEVVLWRVSSADVDPLQERASAEPGFAVAPTETIKRLSPEGAITFTADHRVWVQLLSGGTGVLAGASDVAVIVKAAVRATLAERDLFDRMNPFARSHHSDSISLHSLTGVSRFPGTEQERIAFKQQVAAFYGLTSRLPGFLVDMLGSTSRTKSVTLAHIWPASYTNWEDPRRELALPADFYKEPRNFLLLPRDVHEAFDRGHIIFVPTTACITCFVLPGTSASKRIRKLHGKKLHLPKHATGGVPYKRQLAYFALRAKGRIAVDATVQAALEAAMSASADAAGNEALQELEGRMRANNLIC